MNDKWKLSMYSSDEERKTHLIMKTISWLNETFVPMGMKPIEDLPEAIPANGNSCVIARVLKNNFRDFDAVQVGISGVDLMPNALAQNRTPSSLFNPDLADHLGWSEEGQCFHDDRLPVPQEVGQFIKEFDNGQIPQLIDKEMTIEAVGECEACQVFKVGEGCGCDYCENIVRLNDA